MKRFIFGLMGLAVAAFVLAVPTQAGQNPRDDLVQNVHLYHFDCRADFSGWHRHDLIWGQVPCLPGYVPPGPRRPGWWKHRDHKHHHHDRRPHHRDHKHHGHKHK